MRHAGFSFLLLLLSGSWLAGPGCGPARKPDPDASLDAGVTGDGVRPPDLGTRDGGRVGNVGQPCDPNTKQKCTGEAECLPVSAKVGICAIPNCKMEDITTPAIEDDCPPLTSISRRSICTAVQVPAGDAGYKNATYCLPECKASPELNDCKTVNPELACDPVTLLLNGHAEVCLVPACTENAQCGKDPVKPGATCDPLSGTCQVVGKPGAAIGSPCLVSADCGKGQFCMPEYVDTKTGRTVLAGGYCTIVGCKHGGIWSCPAGSKCFLLGSTEALSLCLAVGCDPTKEPNKDGCRDEAPAGQYTCTVQSGVNVCWIDLKQPPK
jgi:hypothetical protein